MTGAKEPDPHTWFQRRGQKPAISQPLSLRQVPELCPQQRIVLPFSNRSGFHSSRFVCGIPWRTCRSQERLPLTYVTAVAKIALVVIFRTEKEVIFPLLFKLLLYLQHEERI